MPKIKRPGEDTPVVAPAPKKPASHNNHGQQKIKNAALRTRTQDRRAAQRAAQGGEAEDPSLDDTQLNMIAQDPFGYFGSVVSPLFSSYGNASPWGQFLANEAYDQAYQGYTNALLQNPDLHFASFMGGMGAGGGVGELGALGTGQAGQTTAMPVNTGNPFTSSSGIGMGAAPAATMKPLGAKPNKQKAPNQFDRWKKQKKKQGQVGTPEPAQLSEIGINPTTPGTGYADQLRRQFLSLSPLERGEVGQGKTAVPGRWSPWG